MDTETAVVVVSSDDEDAVKTKSKSTPSSVWISAEAPGADDVLVVDGLPCAAVMAKGSSLLDDYEEDDDDCVVLEGDPDKSVVLDQNNGAEHDDLKIVGEKGQIACRDYPHPRHLCVTFPFNHTPHCWHCLQCHCYVCDSLAPCARWGNGSSPMDHCQATDKEEMWKQQRQLLKKSLPTACSGVSAPGVAPPSMSSVSATISMPSPMQSSSNSGYLYPVGNNPMLGLQQSSTSTVCSSNRSRETNLMDPTTIQRLNALIQAKQRSAARANIADKRHPLASCFVQRIRKGGHSAPHARRTAYSNYGRTNDLSTQGPGLVLSQASPPNASADVNCQSSSVSSSANQHPHVPPAPVNTCLPISALGRNHRTIATPSPRPQQRQQATQHMGNFERSAMSGANAARLNEILAGLEAELGLTSRNHTAEFNCPNSSFLPQSFSPHNLGDPSSQVCQPSTNVNVGQPCTNTGMGIFTSGSGLANIGASSLDFEVPAPARVPQLQQEQLAAALLDPPVSGFDLERNSSLD